MKAGKRSATAATRPSLATPRSAQTRGASRIGAKNVVVNADAEDAVVNVGAPDAFASGAMVVVSLASPREKYWGALLALTPAGVAVRAISLESFDDFAAQVREGDAASPGTMFFPMHRVERIELDVAIDAAVSLVGRFEAKSGKTTEQIFGASEGPR